MTLQYDYQKRKTISFCVYKNFTITFIDDISILATLFYELNRNHPLLFHSQKSFYSDLPIPCSLFCFFFTYSTYSIGGASLAAEPKQTEWPEKIWGLFCDFPPKRRKIDVLYIFPPSRFFMYST